MTLRALALPLLVLLGAVSAPTPVPPATFVRWEPGVAGEAVRAAGLVVTNATVPCPADRVDAEPGHCFTPAARIAAPGAPAFVLPGAEGSTNARLGIGQLERGRGPAIILESFSGGAHCCERYAVALPGPHGWRRLAVTRDGITDRGPARLTEFDYGLRAFPTDLDGDGRADFVLGDDAFAYAFGSYAGSMSPPVILNVVGDGFADVSRRPGFRRLFEADLATARGLCTAPGDGERNGACAAFAADAARLGELAHAWPVILAHYDRHLDSGGYPRCTADYVHDRCPPGREIRYPDFPAALRDFLRRDGYISRTAGGA